jgi:hypothetical protein
MEPPGRCGDWLAPPPSPPRAQAPGRHDERGGGDFYLATSGDLHLTISGDFAMAMDMALPTSSGGLGQPEAGGLLRPARLDTKTSWGDRSGWCGEEVSLVAVELQVSVGAADAARTAPAEGRGQQHRVLGAADQASAAVANAGSAPALAQFLTEAVHCCRSGSGRSPGPRYRLPRVGQPVDMVDRWSAWEFVDYEGSAHRCRGVVTPHNAPRAASA